MTKEEKRERNRIACRKWASKNDRKAYYREYDTKRTARPEYVMWVNSRTNAKKKNLENTLLLEDINIPEECPCCLSPINRPSLDRVDNDKGYTKDNIQVICTHCNSVKRNGTADLHRKIAAYIERYS